MVHLKEILVLSLQFVLPYPWVVGGHVTATVFSKCRAGVWQGCHSRLKTRGFGSWPSYLRPKAPLGAPAISREAGHQDTWDVLGSEMSITPTGVRCLGMTNWYLNHREETKCFQCCLKGLVRNIVHMKQEHLHYGMVTRKQGSRLCLSAFPFYSFSNTIVLVFRVSSWKKRRKLSL